MQVTYNTKIKRFVVTSKGLSLIFDSFDVMLGVVRFYRDGVHQGGFEDSELFLSLFELRMGI